jgi:hypothetical protein
MKKNSKTSWFCPFVVFYYGFITYPKLDLISGFQLKVLLQDFIDQRSKETIEKETMILLNRFSYKCH